MIRKRLVATNGTYTDRDGNEKKRYVTIGQLHEHDGREYITLDAHINLAGLIRKDGETRVFVNLYDNDDAKQAAPTARQRKPAETGTFALADDEDDSIPF